MALDTNAVIFKSRLREVLELLPKEAIGRRAWEIALLTPKMAVIRTMKDPAARKRRVVEMFYLVLIEILIDLLSVAAPSDQFWGPNYEQYLKGQPFVRTLLRAARNNTEHLEGVDGYTKMTQKLGENRWSIREYGIQEGWFETGRKDNVWNDVARRLWDNAVDCIEGIVIKTKIKIY